ncbi:MAG: ArsR/SmtB family transcription factor [Bacillota bacterium]
MDELNKDEFAQLSKALGHPHRLKIINILVNLSSDSQCMVGNIVDKLPISQSTVSQHLKILKEAGWIEGNIEGSRVCYCLKEDIFEKYTEMLNKLKEKSENK